LQTTVVIARRRRAAGNCCCSRTSVIGSFKQKSLQNFVKIFSSFLFLPAEEEFKIAVDDEEALVLNEVEVVVLVGSVCAATSSKKIRKKRFAKHVVSLFWQPADVTLPGDSKLIFD
jgi:hypothetical protein